MLHIITPLYRFDNLELIYNSILMNDDITWHISKSNRREDLNNDFINDDKRIKIYNVDCEDTEAYKKRREVLSKIKSGYFCFLDDDTLFHENIYIKYKECEEQNFIGMMVGEQLDYDNKIRLIASKPIFRHIDTGNVLSHYSCLSECRWPESHIPKVNQKDFLFWNSVYEFYGKKCAIWNQPISYYNKLNPKQIYGTKKENHLK
jgi:hypothetical protein